MYSLEKRFRPAMPTFSPNIRKELASLFKEGAGARAAGIARSSNPHLPATCAAIASSAERTEGVCRAEAWWSGWDEAGLQLERDRYARRH